MDALNDMLSPGTCPIVSKAPSKSEDRSVPRSSGKISQSSSGEKSKSRFDDVFISATSSLDSNKAANHGNDTQLSHSIGPTNVTLVSKCSSSWLNYPESENTWEPYGALRFVDKLHDCLRAEKMERPIPK